MIAGALQPAGVLFVVPFARPLVPLLYAAWATIRVWRTGVEVPEGGVLIANFLRRHSIPFSNIRAVQLEEVGPELILRRPSRSKLLRLDLDGGQSVRSFCITEGPSLLPAPELSDLEPVHRAMADLLSARQT